MKNKLFSILFFAKEKRLLFLGVEKSTEPVIEEAEKNRILNEQRQLRADLAKKIQENANPQAVYTVKKGDSLSKIAKQYHVTVDDLYNFHNNYLAKHPEPQNRQIKAIKDKGKIYINQILYIPPTGIALQTKAII